VVYLILALFILGIALLSIELVIPGFGIAGISGIISLLTSIVLTFIVYPFYGIFIILAAAAVLIAIFFIIKKILYQKQAYNQLILNDSVALDKSEFENLDYFLGKEGVTVSPLKPCGIADFKTGRLEVYSIGKYIDSNVKVKVVEISENKVLVKEVSELDKN